MEPEHHTLSADEETLDNLCITFADVIDAKSPFTFTHSSSVSQVAAAMGTQLGLKDEEVRMIRRAALLHDVGKLSVPNSILEKPGALTAEEWKAIANHPFYTHQILNRITGFEELAGIAAAHHEKLDGSGYYLGLRGPDLPLAARILAVADTYDALAADRPYRAAMPTEKALGIVAAQAPNKLDADCVEALTACVETGLEALPGNSYLQSLYTSTARAVARFSSFPRYSPASLSIQWRTPTR